MARRNEAVDALEPLPVNQFWSILAQALETGDPKLPISWSGRRDSNRRRPAWESPFRLKIKKYRADGDACRSKEISNYGSAECAERHAEVERFISDYLCNGELRIRDSVTQALLSRKDAFIPMNCYVNDEFCKANIEGWLAKAEERRSKAVTLQADSPVTTT